MAAIDVTLNNSTALGGEDKPPLKLAEPSRAGRGVSLWSGPVCPLSPTSFLRARPRLASPHKSRSLSVQIDLGTMQQLIGLLVAHLVLVPASAQGTKGTNGFLREVMSYGAKQQVPPLPESLGNAHSRFHRD